MKLLLIVETPDDDRLHYPEIGAALREYVGVVHENNNLFRHSSRIGVIGRTAGPNSMLALNGVRVTEMRVDWRFWFGKLIGRHIRRWLV